MGEISSAFTHGGLYLLRAGVCIEIRKLLLQLRCIYLRSNVELQICMHIVTVLVQYHIFLLKVWQLGSPQPNFTLEGHQRGVNCVDYYHGGDKPYLISGADDSLVKIWDYQNKTCVQTLEGHSQNVSSGKSLVYSSISLSLFLSFFLSPKDLII